MDFNNVMTKNINLSINYIDVNDIELNFECMKDETFKENLQKLFEVLKTEAPESRAESFDEIIQMVRGQLKSLDTVGQILDFLGFSIKMLFVEKDTTADVLLLTDIFQVMPSAWETDPVKVHLITKIIYETLNADFNNTMQVITKIICNNNKLGFYVALALFWALYLSHFKKDSHHYYKMYNVDKFFKLLQNEPFDDSHDADSIFKLLLLISIYQNFVLLAKDDPEHHQVFHDCFKVSKGDREKLKRWLIKQKTLIEKNNPLGNQNQSVDVLMLLEFLELDLIKGISQDDNQVEPVAEQLKGDSHAAAESE